LSPSGIAVIIFSSSGNSGTLGKMEKVSEDDIRYVFENQEYKYNIEQSVHLRIVNAFLTKLQALNQWFLKSSLLFRTAIVFAISLLIPLLSFILIPNVASDTFSLLFFLPIILATWYLGLSAGFFSLCSWFFLTDTQFFILKTHFISTEKECSGLLFFSLREFY